MSDFNSLISDFVSVIFILSASSSLNEPSTCSTLNLPVETISSRVLIFSLFEDIFVLYSFSNTFVFSCNLFILTSLLSMFVSMASDAYAKTSPSGVSTVL